MSVLLLGSASTAFTQKEFNSAGRMAAVAFTASETDTLRMIEFRTGSEANTCTAVELGIYADSAGVPGALLASGKVEGKPATNTWVALTGLAQAVTGGTKYWLAFMPLGGTVSFNYSVESAGTPYRQSEANGHTKLEATAWDGTYHIATGPVGIAGFATELLAKVSLKGSGALAGAARVALNGAVSLRGAGGLAATGRVSLNTSVALKGAGALLVVGRISLRGGVVLAGSGRLVAAGSIHPPPVLASLVLKGAGGLVARSIAPPEPFPGPTPPSPTRLTNPFTYPAFDLLTMQVLDPLPYVNTKFARQLNTAREFQGSLPLTDLRVRELRYLESSRPARTALFVDYLGTLIWGGVLWTRNYDAPTASWQVGAQEFGSYFERRLQAADYTETWSGTKEEDPLKICRQIIEEAKAKPSGNICGGITITLHPAAGSPNKVSVSYPGTQLQTIDSIVSTLSQMGYTFGFDYTFDCEYLPGTKTPSVTLNFWYPRAGRTAGETGIVICKPDLVSSKYPEDGKKAANSIFVTGSGSGGIQPVSGIAEEALLEGYPLLEEMISHVQVNDQSVLTNIAVGELRLRAWPVITPPLVLPVPLPDANGKIDPTKFNFGSFVLGDDFIWKVDPVKGDLIPSPRWPNGMEAEWRIDGWNCTVPDRGLPTIEIEPGIPPFNGIPPPPPIE